MIKTAFCDDDLSTLTDIHRLFDRYQSNRGYSTHNQTMQAAFFGSSLELLVEIEKGARFDILFLDIIMAGENGINTAKEIRQYDKEVRIIFLTSSTEYAVQSYGVGAFYYQLKPIKEERFFWLMDSAVNECKRARERGMILRCKSGITRIALDRLEYCEVIGRTLVFHMENKTVLESTGSMDELWSHLGQYENFLRSHRSFLINMEYVRSISYRAIVMDSLDKIPIPHGKCSEIKSRYLEYACSREQFFVS